MRASLAASIAFISLLSWSPIVVTAQGNTTCKNTSLDWYTSSVGETPCQTYQQLRQICNAAYTVGSLSPFTPPDNCNDQVANCCCNSVSFALSMLCLNCQQGVGSGVNGDTGIDAGVGAYQMYLANCGQKAPNTNQSLPVDIQAAVCNDKIKIDDDLYSLFWSDGSWYYMYTREQMQKNQQTYANNTYTHCASTTITNNTLTLSSSSSSTSTSSRGSTITQIITNGGQGRGSTSSLSVGAIVGIVVGGVLVAILIIGLLVRYLRKHRHIRVISDNVLNDEDEVMMRQGVLRVDPFLPLLTAANVRAIPSDVASVGGSSETRNGKATGPVVSTSQWASEESLGRHVDAGPLLGRSTSGRLPPAYGELQL